MPLGHEQLEAGEDRARKDTAASGGAGFFQKDGFQGLRGRAKSGSRQALLAKCTGLISKIGNLDGFGLKQGCFKGWELLFHFNGF